jgi:hypothetical protein
LVAYDKCMTAVLTSIAGSWTDTQELE